MVVVIGMDPHKRSNTLVALTEQGTVAARARFDTSTDGWKQMRDWATRFTDPVWAVEGARGVGKSAAQRLVAGDATVLDVPAKYAARVRLFGTGNGRKNDPTDAHSIALAAHRSPESLAQVTPDGMAEVLKELSERREQITRARRQEMNRLHRVLSELIPGGTPPRMSLDTARKLRRRVRGTDPVTRTKRELVTDHIDEIVHLDKQLAKTTARITDATLHDQAATAVQSIHGIAEVIAARIIGEVGSIDRFTTPAQFACWNGTAPTEVSSGEHPVDRLSRRGNRKVNHALHQAAIVQTAHDTPGRAYYRRKLAAGKGKMGALRCLKRRISNAVYHALKNASETDPGGHTGATITFSAATPNPDEQHFEKVTPGPAHTTLQATP